MSDNRPGGEPTEEPTPRRLRQARERGQIAKSDELTSAAAFAAAALALAASAGSLGGRLVAAVRTGIERAASAESVPGAVLRGAVEELALLLGPVLGAAFVAALLVGGVQAGGLFTPKALLPRGERLNPVAGLKRMVSAQAASALVRSVVKLVVVAAVAVWTLAPRVGDLPRLCGAPAVRALAWTWDVGMTLLLRVAVAYALLGAADYLWQRRAFWKGLRMTREEVKREHKETEGDPQHKAERQRLYRELLRHQMIEAVRTADCVIVNPDHIAVALRWVEGEMNAPQVVAKGERLVAHQIKEVARRYGVPIYRDVALARALHELELGDEIPEELYDAVAEVLRFVWRESGRGDGGGTK